MADHALTELPHIQDFVIAAITEPRPLMEHAAISSRAAAVTTGNERLSPVEQLDIYREQFWLRHTGALEEDFASVLRLLGRDAFHELCASYIEAHPPQSYTLRDLGDRFADFLEKHPRYQGDALLCDLARVEWAFVEAFDAPDAAPISAHTIASTPEEAWPNAVLKLHPAMRLLALRYPAHELRSTARTQSAAVDASACTTCGEADVEAPLVRPEAADTWLVVFRGADVLKFIDIEREAFVLLGKLRAGVPLGRACEETVSELGLSEETFQAAVGGWFASWTQWGWVTDLVV
jgi:hypothetical protein